MTTGWSVPIFVLPSPPLSTFKNVSAHHIDPVLGEVNIIIFANQKEIKDEIDHFWSSIYGKNFPFWK